MGCAIPLAAGTAACANLEVRGYLDVLQVVGKFCALQGSRHGSGKRLHEHGEGGQTHTRHVKGNDAGERRIRLKVAVAERRCSVRAN